MDTYQFALFFAALLIAYVLVHLRLTKFERYLKEISVLRQLNDRLSGVADAMERIRVDRLEEGLNTLHEDSKDIAANLVRIERALSSLSHIGEAASGNGGAVAAPAQTAAERICAAVEERLFQLGYNKLRVLTDLRHVHLDDEVEVQVECEKRMMPCKGKVTTRNGAILDVDVHSVVGMFP